MQTFFENLSIINMLVFKVEIDIIYNICKKFNLYLIYKFN